MNSPGQAGRDFSSGPLLTTGLPLVGHSVSSEKSRSCWQGEVLPQQRGLLPHSYRLAHLTGRVLGPWGQGQESTNEEESAGGKCYSASLEAMTPADRITGNAFPTNLETQQELEEDRQSLWLVLTISVFPSFPHLWVLVFRQTSCCFLNQRGHRGGGVKVWRRS